MNKIVTTCCLVLLLVPAALSQGLIDTANFTVAATIKPSAYPEWPDSVAAWRVYGTYDLDSDGKKEFLVIVDPTTTATGDTTMSKILRFEANGNDNYALVWSATIPDQNAAQGSWPCLTVSDLDKDGKQEIIFGQPLDARSAPNPNPNFIFIYEYDQTLQNFPAEPTMTSTLGFPNAYYYAITSIVADDVDNDGEIELILSARRAYGGGSGTASTRPMFIYRLNGDVSTGFSSLDREFADTIGTFNGGYYFNNHVVDYDGDGKKEIWGFTWDFLSFSVYEATGKDTYVLQSDVNQVTPPDDYGEQNSVSFFDANKDGKLEMFVAGQTSPPSAVFYLPNVSDVSTLTTTSLKMVSSAFPLNFQGADIGDIDGNGEVDFFIGDWDSRMVYRFRHLAGKTFTDSSGYQLDTLYNATSDSTYDLPNVFVGNDIDGDNKREVIIVNTNTRGGFPNDASLIILESKHVVTGVQTESGIIPSAYELSQNYPNPFNPTTAIKFALPAAGNVSLKVYDLLGKEVASLVNGYVNQGSHSVAFDAQSLGSGVYFYTLRAGSFVETKKMLLVK